MHDLRHDQEAADAATHAARMNPATLRTVPMPDLRGGLRAHYDTRTGDERILAELVRIVDALQGVELRLGLIEETLRGWREDE